MFERRVEAQIHSLVAIDQEGLTNPQPRVRTVEFAAASPGPDQQLLGAFSGPEPPLSWLLRAMKRTERRWIARARHENIAIESGSLTAKRGSER
jgi:hypothetical protein